MVLHCDGVAFALAPKVAINLFSWEACGPHLLQVKFLLEEGIHLWVIIAYAHTTTDPNDTTKN
jgi:hypothetical protein